MEELLQLPLEPAGARHFRPILRLRGSLLREESEEEVEEGSDEGDDGENYDYEEDCRADSRSEG